MNVALIKNAEDDIHHEHGGKDKKGQRFEELLQTKAFALNLAFHRRRQFLSLGFLDVISHIAERRVRFRIEAESDTGELIEVINGLQAELGGRLRQGPDRNQRVLAFGTDVKLA